MGHVTGEALVVKPDRVRQWLPGDWTGEGVVKSDRQSCTYQGIEYTRKLDQRIAKAPTPSDDYTDPFAEMLRCNGWTVKGEEKESETVEVTE